MYMDSLPNYRDDNVIVN